jgi:hypothetical protein
VQIGFLDISNMSGSMQAVYLFGIYSMLAAAFYWFYSFLVKGPEEAEAAK